MKRPRIVVVGSSNTDLVVQAPHLPSPGETVLGRDLIKAAGGKGANQAVAAARLGAEVTLVARLGNDSFGKATRKSLSRQGISTEFLTQDPERPSGVALIIVDNQGENQITVAAGANACLSIEDVEAATESIQGADVVLLQLEVPLATVRRAAELAFEAGVTVILNPAPAQPLEKSLLRKVSLLTPNRSEAAALTGIPVEDEDSLRQAALRLLESGPQNVVLTLGSQGALIAFEGQTERIPSRSVKAVDATAAGDAFNGALAFGLAKGWPLPESVGWANSAASLSVTRLGAQPSLPSWEEVRGVGEKPTKANAKG